MRLIWMLAVLTEGEQNMVALMAALSLSTFKEYTIERNQWVHCDTLHRRVSTVVKKSLATS